ncbi:MAG TPA: UGSC family (seleno)protein [Solirubrobacteraceae bacterium]
MFARLARSVARANGMPTTRQAFVPQPVVGRSAQELRGYVDGEDPVNGGPFMQHVIEGLTNPLGDDDLKGMSFDRSAPALLEPDTEDNLRARFAEERWTDFLPIVLPTEERVQAMLGGTSHAPDEVVGRMRPTAFREFWEFTVEKVAVNAVMAGAKPEYLPVILAMMAGGMTARSSSTTSFAAVAMVNGPIRNEIDMNSGIGAFGPYNHANATIGRAYALASQNLQGGSTPGETYMGSQGNSLGYSACFAENEERSPYTPFHVQHGFDASTSTVSTFLGGWYTQFGTVRDDAWREHFRRQLTACDPFIGPIVALDPLAANKLVDYGFDAREKLAEWLSESSALPAREYWDNQWMQTLVKPWAILGREPFASHLKAAPDEPVRMFRPEDISIAVVGGETGGTYKMIGGALRDSIVSVDDWR